MSVKLGYKKVMVQVLMNDHKVAFVLQLSLSIFKKVVTWLCVPPMLKLNQCTNSWWLLLLIAHLLHNLTYVFIQSDLQLLNK